MLAGLTNLDRPNFLDDHVGKRYGDLGGYVLVAPQYRLVVTATDKRRSLEQLPAPGVNPTLDRFLQGHEGTAVMVNPLGQSMMVSDKGIPAAGWVLAVVLPTEEAFAPTRSLQERMLMAMLLFALLAGGLIWWLLRRELSPMLSTVQTLARLAVSDQPPPPLQIERDDEIGKLIGGFNRLLERLNQREVVLKKMVAESQSAEAELRIAATAFESQQGMIDHRCAGPDPARQPGLHRDHRLQRGRGGGPESAPAVSRVATTVPFTRRCGQASSAGSWQGEIWNRRKNGEVYPGMADHQRGQGRGRRVTHYVGTFTDITERKSAEDEIDKLAFYDPLTQLPNRRLLLDRLAASHAGELHGIDRKGALLFIDLDNFKTLNDTLGHDRATCCCNRWRSA